VTRIAAALVLAAGAACDNRASLRAPEPGWERMLEQPRVDPYAASRFFRDGRAMRDPPAGTVPRDRITGDPARTRGLRAGTYVTDVPIPLTGELLRQGRVQFETVCSVCHGVRGDGVSRVAQSMELRPPPSLHEARIRALAPGRVFETITHGYGLMPSYAAMLDVDARWAVVAYVGALQLSQWAPVAELPAAVRARLEQEVAR
jgi:mono/diheme cytochrome c family protein